jgi:large subunit ribosomal protein L22
MKTKAQAKWVRIGPRKARRVIDVVRGKRAVEALAELSFMPQKGARIVEKVVKSAVANAKNNLKQNEANLYISEAYVDEATPFRRFKAAARGRVAPRTKRQSHVTVFVSSKEERKK